MKKLIKNMIPDSIRVWIIKQIKEHRMKKLMKNDQERFLKYSFGKKDITTFNQLEARLTKEYHSIEKGLSYKELRLGFGKQVLENVLNLMKEYRRKGYPLDSHVYQTALSNLHSYIAVHDEAGFNVNHIKEEVKHLQSGLEDLCSGGILKKTKQTVIEQSKADFKIFAESRHSVRDYSGEPVDMAILDKAFELAKRTPSACNRQSWKIRIVEDSKLKKTIQKNQNGNRGFGDYIDKFIIITADVQYYDRIRERNQANIDGGMYAMNLLYALHYYDIAAVPLSGSLNLNQEDNLRAAFEIPDYENFIMFVGIGNYVDEYKVPKSHRREVKYTYYETKI
ncbi:MAG: nitroreductase family protein [Tetragenococcus koreensis]|nr:nitroreductase family protein [Tetragenococcus koreensis]